MIRSRTSCLIYSIKLIVNFLRKEFHIDEELIPESCVGRRGSKAVDVPSNIRLKVIQLLNLFKTKMIRKTCVIQP